GNFGAATQYSVGGGPYAITTGDFNGDGVLDLVTADSLDRTASVLLGTGDGSFGDATSFSVGGGYPYSIITGDFNGDGVLDLVTANSSGGSDMASVLLGLGGGSFAAATQFSVGGDANSITTGD